MKRLNCQVGGGIRTLEAARELLRAGAGRVILGSILLKDGEINGQCAAELARELGTAPLVFALDSRGGRVAIDGWRQETALTAFEMIRALEPFCETFLYTHIDTEGLMGGIPMEAVGAIRQATSRRLIVAGGITTQVEIDRLDELGMDAVVGMALYSGKIPGINASAVNLAGQNFLQRPLDPINFFADYADRLLILCRMRQGRDSFHGASYVMISSPNEVEPGTPLFTISVNASDELRG